MKKEPIIHEFDPVIYPVKLWVSITTNFEPLQKRFCDGINKESINLDILKEHSGCTCEVKSKDTEELGVLIVFCGYKFCTINDIVHETAHAVDFIWEYLSEEKPGDEANAYLSGWIAECCEKVKNNKV